MNRIDEEVTRILNEQAPDVISPASAPPAPTAEPGPGPGPEQPEPVGEFDIDDELGGGMDAPPEDLDFSKIEMMANQLKGLHGNFQELRDIFPSGDQRRDQASELGSILHGIIRDLESLVASR